MEEELYTNDSEDAAVQDENMMTGDTCADKAISGGKNPEPPPTEYDY